MRGSRLEKSASAIAGEFTTKFKFIYLKNSSTWNANAVSWTNALFDTPKWMPPDDFTNLNDGIRCNFNGVVRVFAHVSLGPASSTRGAPKMRIVGAQDIESEVEAKTGYIRNTINHKDSSLHIAGFMFEVVGGEILHVQNQRATTATTVINPPANGSFFLAERFA